MAGTEKVGIEIELMGGEEAYNLLKRIDDQIDTLNKKRKFKSLSGLKSAKSELEGYMKELKKLNKEQEKWESLAKRVGKENMSAFGLREWERVNGEIKEAEGNIKKMKADMDEVTIKTKTFGQTFKSISSSVAHIGSAMQSLGNALVRVTSPFRRLTTGLLMGAGYKALNTLTEGLSGSFARADTMNKYTKLMAEYETANYTAQKSREDLDASIQGLPIALDEAISLAQRYTLSLGDMERGTQLAIATNNAFLASMATETQRYQGMLQLQDLMNGKDLTSREWMSLGSSMGKAINEVGLKLGYSKEQLGEFRQELYAGNIATKDFLDALIAVGTGKGSLVALAKTSAETWEGLFSNARIAVTRMGANIIDTVNETFKKATGRTLLQQLLGIDSEGNDLNDGLKAWINGISESIQGWIKSNPDKLIEFFNTIKSIDWKGLAKGLAEGTLEFARLIGTFANWVSGKDLSKLGKWMPRLNILGNLLLVTGGFLKGTRHIWGLLGAGGKWLGSKALGKMGKIGIFGKIASIFGKKKDLVTAGEAAKEVPTVAGTMRSAFKSLEGLIKAAGAVTLVAGTGFVAFKAAKSILKDLKEMTDLVNGGGWDNVGYVASGVIVAIGAFTEIFNAIGTALGANGLLATAIAGAASFIVTGSFAADMWAIKQGVIQIRDTITELDNIATEITNFKGIGTLGSDVRTRFSNTIKAINEIKDMFVGKSGDKMDRGQVEQGLPTFGVGKVTAITNLVNAMKGLKKFADALNSIASISINEGATEKVKAIGKAITAVDKAMPNAIKNGNKSYGNMKTNVTSLNKALKQMVTMASRINTLAGTTVNTEGFKGFVEQLRTALQGLRDLSGELILDIEVKLSPMFGSSVNAVKQNIKEAKRDIQRLKTPVAFTIPVKVTFSITSNLLSALGQINRQKQTLKDAAGGNSTNYGSPIGPPKPEESAMGGLIYRARGGGVPWKRRGTDTVPAMLTPGEFVHNRKAVSTFGIDFMRKVNSLDMKGAMNELMHRAGHMANVNRGAVITNNYNNNSKVTINNSNNAGAGFTFKSASRFVGAF